MEFFGTDGIRGEFGTFLTPEFIYKIGKSAAKVFEKQNIKTICIGQDPRISSQGICDILSGTLQSYGINVEILGVVSTPVVSYTIVNEEKIKAGIMISASHNPYGDNGIKFFGENGQKISEEIETKIETNLETNFEVDLKKIGYKKTNNQAVENYKNFLVEQGASLKNKKIGLDMACGSASVLALEIFQNLGATCVTIGDNPDGYNINDNIGSTHPQKMQEIVKKENLDFAFCYDGDADRVQLIDNTGEVLDGDYILFMIAQDLKNQNKLTNNQVVSTVMSNLGYKKAMKELNITNIETQVGDKYVMKEMHETKSVLGGEQSGHIILSEYISTGDGILISVILSKIIIEEDFTFEKLKQKMKKFPQVLHNLKCADKKLIMENKDLLQYVQEENQKLGNEGRILVRASGTENLVRIMVENAQTSQCYEIIEKIIAKIEKI